DFHVTGVQTCALPICVVVAGVGGVFGALLVDAADRVLGLRLGGVAVVSVGEDRVPVAVPAAGGGAVCEPGGVADGGGELLTGPRVFARGDVDGRDVADGLLGAGEDGVASAGIWWGM